MSDREQLRLRTIEGARRRGVVIHRRPSGVYELIGPNVRILTRDLADVNLREDLKPTRRMETGNGE